MEKKRLKRMIGVGIVVVFIVVGISYNGYIRSHTFTLSGEEAIKHEQIQPTSRKVKVNSNTDTKVIFTDVESGKKYTIGYVTPGAHETIQLERGKWYQVEGSGELTIRPINVRVE